jgi:hypothetical protein
MRQETIDIFTFAELSNEAKQAAISYARQNWHDLGEHTIHDMVQSLRALAEAVGGELDYCISITPDRGEYVKITGYDRAALQELEGRKEDYPLTGMCFDFDVIDGLANDSLDINVLHTLHKEGDYIYSDEGLSDMLEHSGHEFRANGELHT